MYYPTLAPEGSTLRWQYAATILGFGLAACLARFVLVPLF